MSGGSKLTLYKNNKNVYTILLLVIEPKIFFSTINILTEIQLSQQTLLVFLCTELVYV